MSQKKTNCEAVQRQLPLMPCAEKENMCTDKLWLATWLWERTCIWSVSVI